MPTGPANLVTTLRSGPNTRLSKPTFLAPLSSVLVNSPVLTPNLLNDVNKEPIPLTTLPTKPPNIPNATNAGPIPTAIAAPMPKSFCCHASKFLILPINAIIHSTSLAKALPKVTPQSAAFSSIPLNNSVSSPISGFI